METITVLPKEITTAVRWAFRARQILPAYAHPVGQLTLYAELFHGTGLQAILALLEAGQVPQPVEVVVDEWGYGVVNGRSQSPLFCVPYLFDFAVARAAQQGSYCLQVSHLPALPLPFFEALLVQMGERGYGGWVKTATNEFLGVRSGGDGAITDSILLDDRSFLGGENGRLPTPEAYTFTLFCTKEGFGQAVSSSVMETQVQQRSQSWEHAYRHGIPVQATIWQSLKAITNEILI